MTFFSSSRCKIWKLLQHFLLITKYLLTYRWRNSNLLQKRRVNHLRFPNKEMGVPTHNLKQVFQWFKFFSNLCHDVLQMNWKQQYFFLSLSITHLWNAGNDTKKLSKEGKLSYVYVSKRICMIFMALREGIVKPEQVQNGVWHPFFKANVIFSSTLVSA